MKQYNIYLFLILLGLLSCKNTQETDKINLPVAINDSRLNDYALYDEKGNFHRLSRYNDSKAIVLFVQGNGCPIVRNALVDFNNIVDHYSPQGFKFFMINSNIQDNRASIAKESEKYDFKVPVLNDKAQILADALDIEVTAEIIILAPTTREIVFRGPINNRLDYETQKAEATETYLIDALEAIIDNKTPTSKQEVTKGCRVKRLKSLEKNTLTFTNDVAPILINHCVRCHVDGGVAPWSMTDYNKIVGWSAMIEQVLLSKRMPPWKADPEIGKFSNSFAIKEEDRRKLLRWIEDGMQFGEGKDPLKNLSPDKALISETNLKPDTTITLKKEKIPANGIIDYRYQKIKLGLKEGKWLAGLKISTGNPKVVHHLSISSSSTPELALDRKPRKWVDNIIAVIANGTSKSFIFPEGSGIFLDKNSELNIQTHYVTTGKKEEDTSTIHLFYHDKPPKKQYFSFSVWDDNFKIKPFEKNKIIEQQDTITKNIKVHSVFPHMHYRGKQIKMIATKPNGDVVELVSVPDYDFNWQFRYVLKKPIFLPSGTIIKAEGIFDNSYQNRLNPDPSKKVTYGLKSTDEMFMGIINYTLADDYSL